MDKRKDDLSKITKESYKEKIVEMIGRIEDVDYLEFICNMMLAFKEKWGI